MKKKVLRNNLQPFYLITMTLTALLSVISGLLSLPSNLKIIFISIFGALFCIVLGIFIQSMRSAGYGIISWHLVRQKHDVLRFFDSTIKKVGKNSKKINIDCMGIKMGTPSDYLQNNINSFSCDEVTIRYLILKTDSEGTKTRAKIEGRKKMNLTTERALEAAIQVRDLYNRRWESKVVSIKTFSFLPSFYIIRINELMLVGFYLREKGIHCPYLILELGLNSYFTYFSDYFDKIYNSDLAKPILE